MGPVAQNNCESESTGSVYTGFYEERKRGGGVCVFQLDVSLEDL